jgi:hypothetical protein
MASCQWRRTILQTLYIILASASICAASPITSSNIPLTTFVVKRDDSSSRLESPSTPSTTRGVAHIEIIIGVTIAIIVVLTVLSLYLCWWRPRQQRRNAAEPYFNILYNERAKSYDSDKCFVQIELDVAGTRPTTPAQSVLSALSAVNSSQSPQEIYELDGRPVERRSWFGGVRRWSTFMTASRWSSSTNSEESSLSPWSSTQDKVYTTIPVVVLASPRASFEEMDHVDRTGRDRSPSPIPRVGRHPLRHEYRTLSRNPTISPARNLTSTWNSLRVPVSPVSNCGDEEREIACDCPAHI